MSIDTFPHSSLLTVNIIPLKNRETMIYATTVPENGLGEGSYRFYFTDGKLKTITFNTYDYLGDDAVYKTKSSYSEIKNILSERYGKPTSTDERVYSNNFEFFPCITNKYCGSWSSDFSNKTTNVRIFIGMGLNEEGYNKTRESGRVSVEFSPLRKG